MTVRKIAHSLGYRFRLHRRDLPGKPDLVFPSKKKVILVHGCFWHAQDCNRGYREPKENAAYWSAKIARNRERDHKVQTELLAMRWQSLIIWECETKARATTELPRTIKDFLDEPPDANVIPKSHLAAKEVL